ncbi:histidine phosphatase family protein [Streptomyces sp. NPDC058740]|uniref:histidine phosphatase family protein n=1 Tax=Streptomyces sp. NPDC058740 TaxID=3346619 RepID=UPI0036A640CE
MADIWLMRHGAYEGHRPGHHAPHEATLTQEGHEQVRCSLPLPEGITAIVTSPIPRARYCAAFLHHTAQRHGPLLAVSHTPLLGVLTHLPEGPAAFTTAARTPCQFAERRPFISR